LAHKPAKLAGPLLQLLILKELYFAFRPSWPDGHSDAAEASTFRASANAKSSRQGLPASCTPMGNPEDDWP
jgi:hypothetical protein